MTDATRIVESLAHHDALVETPLSKKLDRFILSICGAFNWIWVVLLLVIIGNVILRYVFSQGMIELEELQWHLYAIGWLMALSSTFIVDGHVRVDALHDKLSYKGKMWFELVGLLVLFLPFVSFIVYYSLDLVALSWSTSETSTSANGLPARWIVKGFLCFGFSLLCLAGISRLIKVVASLRSPPDLKPPSLPEGTAQRMM